MPAAPLARPRLAPAAPGPSPLAGRCRVKGLLVPDDRIGELRDSADLLDDPAALRSRLADDGYLLLAGVLPLPDVAQARHEVFTRLASVDEIAEPCDDGIATGRSRRTEREPDSGRFWQSVSEGPALRRLTHGAAMHRMLSTVFGEPARAHDYLFLRAGARGRATGLHFDYPFFSRGHDRVCTVWTPIGDVPVEDGPIVIVEGSHRHDDLIQPMIGFDVATDSSRKADLGTDAIAFARARDTRLLSRDFRAGDLVLFGLYTAHGSLDNHSPINRVRLSCDLRWQPASLPADPRYCGPSPGGTTGAGYRELNGAKPLTEDWHIR